MKKAFTLVELLATIIILGILYLIITPSVSRYITTSNESLNKSKINGIIKSAGNYFIEFQTENPNAFDGTTNVFDLLEIEGNTNKFTKKEVYINSNGDIALAFATKINKVNYCYFKNFDEENISLLKNPTNCTITGDTISS